TLSRARARLARGSRRFSSAVEMDLGARGLLDPSRKAVRDRLLAIGIVLLLGGAVGAIPIAALVDRYGPWPFLLALGFVVAGFAAAGDPRGGNAAFAAFVGSNAHAGGAHGGAGGAAASGGSSGAS